MFQRLKSSFCCIKDEFQINIQIELMNCKDFPSSERREYNLDVNKFNSSKESPQLETPFNYSDYSFYILVDFNNDCIIPELDFLYIQESDESVYDNINQLTETSIIPVTVNRFNQSTGYCQISLNKVDPTATFAIHYYRHNKNNKSQIKSLYKTKLFKLSLKNKLHNLFPGSVNFGSEELTIIFENDSFFNKFNAADIIKGHRRVVSMANTVPERSMAKTRGSSRDSRPEEKLLPLRTNKNSLFSSFIGNNEYNSLFPSRGSGINTNKSSFTGDLLYGNSLKPKLDTLKSTIPEYTKQGSKDVSEHLTSQDEFCCESMIIHESKDNDEYVKRICHILAENLENSLNQSVEINTNNYASPEENNKIKKHSIEQSKIFGLLKSQEGGRESTTVSTKPRFTSPDQVLENLGFITTPNRETVNDNHLEAPKIIRNILGSLDETINESTQKKIFNSPVQSVQGKENMTSVEKAKPRSSLKYTGRNSPVSKTLSTQTNTRESYPRKALKDITNTLKTTSSPRKSDINSRYSLDYRRFNHIFTSEESDKSPDLLVTEFIDTEPKENSPRDSSKVTSRKPKKDFNLQLQLCENDLFCDEELKEPTPRDSEIDFKTFQSPGENRLHTVEEVCSSSKESSTGGEYPIRSFASRSTLSRRDFMTNSARVYTERRVVSELDEYEDENKELIIGVVESDSSEPKGKDLPLEIMILKNKLKEIGIGCSYDPKNCLVSVTDKNNGNTNFMFKWYQNTSERDLNLYFRDIVESFGTSQRK